MAFGNPKAQIEITAKNKTQTAFRQVTRDLGRMTSGIRGVLGPLALLGASTAFVAFGRNTLKAADDIGKFADRIGITTTALQKYRFAFDLAGVSQEETDKGLLTFSKRIGEARAGTGAMVDTLRKLNPELLKSIVNSKSEADALELIFKGMGKAKSAAEKNAIANSALGRAGVKMTAAFKKGSQAFFDATREAERLGLVIDEKLIRNAEKLNDDFTRASGIIGTQLRSAFLELAPEINSAVLELTSFVTELNNVSKLTDKLLNDQSLGAAFGRVQDQVQDLNEKLKANQDSIFSGLFTQLNKEIEEELEILEIIKKAIIDTVRAGGKISGEVVKPQGRREGTATIGTSLARINDGRLHDSRFANQLPDITQKEKDLLAVELRRLGVLREITRTGFSPEIKRHLDDIDSQVNEFDLEKLSVLQAERAKAEFLIKEGLIDASQQFPDLPIEETERFNRALADEVRVFELLKDPLDEAARLHNLLEDQLLSGSITSQEYADAVKRLYEEFGVVTDTVDPVLAALDSIKSGLESNFTDVIFDATQGIGSLAEGATAAVDLILKEMIRLQVVKPLLNSIFGGSGSSGGLFGTALSLAGAFFSGGTSTVATAFAAREAGAAIGSFGPGFASGGSFEVGGGGGRDKTQVGFMATKGERVTVETPAQQRGSKGIVIHMDLRGSNGDAAIEAAVNRGLRQAGPRFVNASVKAIKDGRSRDPQFFG